MKKVYIIFLFGIILLAGFLRFYKLHLLPDGLYIDEASQGYNAYSLLLTGKDRYSEPFPIMFRQFGSFQAPLYTYLTVISVKIFGLSMFSVRSLSALMGVAGVVVTYLLVSKIGFKKKYVYALFASFFVAIAPWSISFSRYATEANLGFGLFSTGILFLFISLKNPKIIPIASFFLGLSTHAYYSERIIAPLILVSFVFIFRSKLIKYKNWLFVAVLIFGLLQIPHLITLKEGAFSKRLDEVSYMTDQFYKINGVNFHNIPMGRMLYISRELLSLYSAYFSPRNLFFDPDPQDARSIPNLSVFYVWMLIPFVLGLRFLIKNIRSDFAKLIFLLLVISPIPSSLTRDPFYTLRVVDLLWVFSIIIAIGTTEFLVLIRERYLKLTLIIFLSIYSIYKLCISYFVYFNYERAEAFQYSTKKLAEKTLEMSDSKFVIDTTRNYTIGVIQAFFRKYEPQKVQKIFRSQIQAGYYSNYYFDEPYFFENLEVRPIFWQEDDCSDLILAGDTLAISQGQVKEHRLKLEFEITDKLGNVVIRGFRTNPKEKCFIKDIS